MSKKININKLIKDSKIISNIIAKTDTDYRGNLLKYVSDDLSNKSQFYTSKLIKEVAIIYGIMSEE